MTAVEAKTGAAMLATHTRSSPTLNGPRFPVVARQGLRPIARVATRAVQKGAVRAMLAFTRTALTANQKTGARKTTAAATPRASARARATQRLRVGVARVLLPTAARRAAKVS